MYVESPMQVPAADGYLLGVTLYRPEELLTPISVVIINCATGVKASYYCRYARFLAEHGYLAITYDYRGIGASRPISLRKLNATKMDWGSKDFEGILQWVMRDFPDATIAVVGHSIGGVVPGFSPSNARINSMITVGAQFAYWKDYAQHARLSMLLKWHILMPALTMIVGYFPGRWLGWLEDLPAGVAFEWACRKATLESVTIPVLSQGNDANVRHGVVQSFAKITCPILAYSIADDSFGTPAAILRLLNYYRHSDRTHVMVTPDEFHLSEIGHFAFFHDRFSRNLWPESLIWLRTGKTQRQPLHFLPSMQ